MDVVVYYIPIQYYAPFGVLKLTIGLLFRSEEEAEDCQVFRLGPAESLVHPDGEVGIHEGVEAGEIGADRGVGGLPHIVAVPALERAVDLHSAHDLAHVGVAAVMEGRTYCPSPQSHDVAAVERVGSE